MANERTPHIVPDVLESGEDVTRETDRSLILRAVNLGMRNDANIRKLDVKVDRMALGLKIDLGDKEGRLRVLEGAAAASDADDTGSYQPFDPAIAALRRDVKRRVKDPNDPLNASGAVDFFEAVQTVVKERKELAVWRWIKKANSRFWWEVIKAVVQLAVGGGIVELLHKTGH